MYVALLNSFQYVHIKNNNKCYYKLYKLINTILDYSYNTGLLIQY